VAPLRKQSSQRDREKGLKLPTRGQLESVWNEVLADREARRALDQLKRDGFSIGDLSPQDPTFHRPSWADYIAAIPLLDNRPSRSHYHLRVTLRKHLPLVRALRDFAQQFDDPFRDVSLISTRDTTIQLHEDARDLANSAASFIEKFLSWDWSVRERNPRNALIAELRWTIRNCTRTPHDRELSAVIDAACRAAGRDELLLDNSTLDRIEKREKEIRVKSFQRLNSCAGLSRPPQSKSTRNPKKRH
jgi:hypothetical protein